MLGAAQTLKLAIDFLVEESVVYVHLRFTHVHVRHLNRLPLRILRLLQRNEINDLPLERFR